MIRRDNRKSTFFLLGIGRTAAFTLGLILPITFAIDSFASQDAQSCNRAFAPSGVLDRSVDDSGAVNSYSALRGLVGSKRSQLDSQNPFSNWSNLDIETSVISDSISIRQVREQYGRNEAGFKFCGTCKMMMNGYLRAFILPMMKFTKKIEAAKYRSLDRDSQAIRGKFALLHVNGVLIGAIKLTGERSMLALRDVQNTNGETVLSIGGVYSFTDTFKKSVLYPTANQVLKENGIDPTHLGNTVLDDPHVRVLSINVTSLTVMPETFLLNRNHLELDQNIRILNAVFPPSVSRSTWNQITAQLAEVRSALESAESTSAGLDTLRNALTPKSQREL